MLKKTFKLSGILLLIAFSTALLLSLTNEATKDIIAERQRIEQVAAMKEVIKADSYQLMSGSSDDYEVYAAYIGNEHAGYAVSLSESGYGGEISMMVGVSKDCTVSGLKIVDMSETPGLGENAKKPEFTNSFKNLSADQVALTNSGGKIQALTGATVTSKAVTAGVRRALDIIDTVQHPGGVTNGQ